MLIGKTRTNQPVEGYQDAPVFEGEFEEKEGKISLVMDSKDAEYIYENKPMVIGIKVPDEDVEGNFQIVYFTLGIDRKETDDVVMYQLVMTDEEEQTITKLSLAFLDDGDDIKVLYGEEEMSVGTKLYKHAYTDGSENYTIIIVKYDNTPIPECNDYDEMYEEIIYHSVTMPTLSLGGVIVYQGVNQPLARITANLGDIVVEELDDFNLEGATDVVTPL